MILIIKVMVEIHSEVTVIILDMPSSWELSQPVAGVRG